MRQAQVRHNKPRPAAHLVRGGRGVEHSGSPWDVRPLRVYEMAVICDTGQETRPEERQVKEEGTHLGGTFPPARGHVPSSACLATTVRGTRTYMDPGAPFPRAKGSLFSIQLAEAAHLPIYSIAACRRDAKPNCALPSPIANTCLPDEIPKLRSISGVHVP